MKNYFKVKCRSRVFELLQNDFVQAAMTVQMEVGYPALQVHTKEEAHQSQVVITMKMTDKNRMDFMIGKLILHQLHLRAFATIN